MDCYVVLPGRYIIENAGVNFFFCTSVVVFCPFDPFVLCCCGWQYASAITGRSAVLAEADARFKGCI